jgi:hypothetical protein
MVTWLLTLVDIGEMLRVLAGTRLDFMAAVLAVLVAIRSFIPWRWLYVLRVLRVEARLIEVFLTAIKNCARPNNAGDVFCVFCAAVTSSWFASRDLIRMLAKTRGQSRQCNHGIKQVK